ncbi:hypothetical protein ABID76_001404 [Burkholderia ambifaria]
MTVPVRAIRDTSLRSRSTIITFSARVLRIVREERGRRRIFTRIGRARRSALHRPRAQHVAALLDEQLRRARHDPRAAGQRDQRAVTHGLTRAQPPVQRGRRAEHVEIQPVRVVDLVRVARAQCIVHGGDRRIERVARHALRDVRDARDRRRAAAILLREPRVDFVARQALAARKQQKAQRGMARLRSFQIASEFVIADDHRMQPVAQVLRHRRIDVVEPRRIRAYAFAHETGIQTTRPRNRGRVAIVQERE